MIPLVEMFTWPPWNVSSSSVGLLQQMLVQPSSIGEEGSFAARGFGGPSSYNQGTPPQLYPSNFGLANVKVFLPDSCTASGTYFVRLAHLNEGALAATMRWYQSSSSSEVANGTDLSGEKIRVMAFGYH